MSQYPNNGGTGDVNGPGSSTANGLASFTDTTGKNIQSQSHIRTGANSTLTGGNGESLTFTAGTGQNISLNTGVGQGVFLNSGNMQLTSTNSAATTAINIANLSNTANSNAALSTTVGGASAGNPYYVASIIGGQAWSWGIDNAAAGDPFKISANITLGTNDLLTINTNGSAVLSWAPIVTTPTTINLTIGTAQAVYTVPTGKSFQLTRLLVRGATAITGSPQMACGSIGPGYADLVNAFSILGGLNNGTALAPVSPNPIFPTIAAGTTINCIVPATAAAGTVIVQLEGILF